MQKLVSIHAVTYCDGVRVQLFDFRTRCTKRQAIGLAELRLSEQRRAIGEVPMSQRQCVWQYARVDAIHISPWETVVPIIGTPPANPDPHPSQASVVLPMSAAPATSKWLPEDEDRRIKQDGVGLYFVSTIRVPNATPVTYETVLVTRDVDAPPIWRIRTRSRDEALHIHADAFALAVEATKASSTVRLKRMKRNIPHGSTKNVLGLHQISIY